jgi:hypothetical protein
MPDDPMTLRRRASDAGDWRPIPDPTELTDAAIVKSIAAQRDYIDAQLAIRDERLNGLRELHGEKFESVDTQFKERDTRSDREARDNKIAVDAAFAAQKESAAREGDSNQKAIDKSEVATAEKIDKLGELATTTTNALADKIDDLKGRISDVAVIANATVDRKLGAKEDRTALYATIAVLVSVIVLVLALAGFLATRPGA